MNYVCLIKSKETKEIIQIPRKRSVHSYIHKIELFSMNQGFDSVTVDSLRWQRLDLCIDSIVEHLSKELGFYGVRV